MDTEILERHAPGLVIPDATLTEFVLGPAWQRGSKSALVDAVNGQALSCGELPGAVRRLAGGLAAGGVRPGDVLALCAPNGIEFVVTLHAAMTAGAVVATVNPLWTGEEVARQLRQTGARWLVSTPGLVEEKLRDATAGTQVMRTFLIGDGAVGGTSFRSGGRRAPGRPVRPSPSAAGLLLSSSGTTGLPKSVELTHQNVVANLCQVRLVHHVTEDDVVIAALPMFHCFALYVSVNLSLLQGATVVILPRFELGAFLRVIEDHKVTRAEVVPPMVLALAASDMVSGYDLASLRVVTSAGAPLSGELARACAARLGCRVKQVYGMTELGGRHIPPDDGPDKPDSVGPALPGTGCRIVDPDSGMDAGPGQPGELLLRSPSTMRGYLGDPEATAATIDEQGWLHTGDVVRADEDGWYYVTDRIKELIKYKGHQVAPAELEALLLTHPAVAGAAVVRSPDDAAGEVPKAFIVLRQPASADELMAWVAARAAPYKRIRLVEFVDAIPVSPSGKILRRLLTERNTAGKPASPVPAPHTVAAGRSR